VPTIQYMVVTIGGTAHFTNWTFTDSSGAKHAFANITGSGTAYNIGDSRDGSSMRLDTTNMNDIVVYLKDGTTAHFNESSTDPGFNRGYFTKIVDTNGNTTNAVYNNSTNTLLITDTVGRKFTANFANSSIQYNDPNGISRTAVFATLSSTTGSAITLTHPQGSECSAKDPVVTGPTTAVMYTSGTSYSSETLTIPNGGSGQVYRFDYNLTQNPKTRQSES
jgi:hypothetical protein